MTENELIRALSRRHSDSILLFAENSSLVLLLAAVAVIGIFLAVLFSVLAFQKRAKKRALMTEEILPALASRFGTNAAVWEFGKSIGNSNVALQFTRRGTNFNAQIVRAASNEFEDAQSAYQAEFRLPERGGEQFYIYPRSDSSDFSAQSQHASIAEMPDDVVFYGSNAPYLKDLVNDEKIRREILKYRRDASAKFEISFAGGVFTVSQIFASEDDWETEAERIEQICRTAIVFHEALIRN